MTLQDDGHCGDGDVDEDKVDADADVDVDADCIDVIHPAHLYTYHPFHPSHHHLFRSLLVYHFPRGFHFSFSFLRFPLHSFPSLPVLRVELRASQD